MVQETQAKLSGVRDLGIIGAKRWKSKIFPDKRGAFSEIYRDAQEMLGVKLVQCNISESKTGVFRGMHFQHRNPQGKLITVMSGRIIDFAIDLRLNSKTHQTMIAVPMEFGDCIYLPPGTAHGFYARGPATIMYQCTTPYDPETDDGIYYKSGPWGANIQELIEVAQVKERTVIMSDKDKNLPKYDAKRVYFNL